MEYNWKEIFLFPFSFCSSRELFFLSSLFSSLLLSSFFSTSDFSWLVGLSWSLLACRKVCIRDVFHLFSPPSLKKSDATPPSLVSMTDLVVLLPFLGRKSFLAYWCYPIFANSTPFSVVFIKKFGICRSYLTLFLFPFSIDLWFVEVSICTLEKFIFLYEYVFLQGSV